ncbi:ion channel protein [Rhodococcus sp. SGAir0479]|nr:ion channel protein [Rhodococcus sp. SGAir0479]
MQDEEHPDARVMVREAALAVVVGVAATVVPIAVLAAARGLAEVLYERIPATVGFSGDAPWWIFGVLTATGLAVGSIVRLAPGHGGRDSATAGLIGPPMALRVLPSLLVALVLALGAGVSLSPENVLISVNAALATAVLGRGGSRSRAERVVPLATAATIGVQFGTPVAAPLAYLELTGRRVRGSLWEAVTAPLVAAGAGAVTMALLRRPILQLDLTPTPPPAPTASGVLGGVAIATATAVVVLAAVYAYRVLHAAFHRISNPVVMTGLGGALLGVLGVVGGRESMFKDVATARTLVAAAPDLSVSELALTGLCSLAAFTLAAASGFRGGRVIASAVVGVTAGLLGHAVAPVVPVSLAIACGVLGAVVVAVRSCWLGLFVPVAMVGSIAVLPVLCLAVLPVWLLVVRRPTMTIRPAPPEPEAKSA